MQESDIFDVATIRHIILFSIILWKNNSTLACQIEGEGQDKYYDFKKIIEEVNAPTKCKDDKEWSILAMDGDLLSEELKSWRKLHPQVSKTSVAIIDTGIPKKLKHRIDSNITYRALSSDVDAPQAPSSMHGYSVASLISSNMGLYSHCPITFYGVGRGPEGTVDQKTAQASYLDACENGNFIINASHTRNPNAYSPTIEEVDRSLIEKLEEHGCILVNSSGNDSNRDPYFTKDANIYDSLVRVSSLRYSDSLAAHSNLGEISAPGEKVYVYQDKPSGICRDRFGGLSNGTSYAAPLVASTYAMVREVLNSSPIF